MNLLPTPQIYNSSMVGLTDYITNCHV